MDDSPLTLPERLTQQFYDWEQRGRGWRVSPYTVELEPPFRPFTRYIPDTDLFDDGRRPSLITRGVSFIREKLGRTRINYAVDFDLDPDPYLDEREDDTRNIALRIQVPEESSISADLAESMLLSLGTSASPVSFELVGAQSDIILQFVAQEDDVPTIRGTLESYLPGIVVDPHDDALASRWESSAPEREIVEFGLSREFMLPLSLPGNFAIDPLLGFVSTLQELGRGEYGVLQVLFQQVSYPWAESALRAVTDGRGTAFFADAPETVPLTAEKISSPLFAVVVRIAAAAETHESTWRIIRGLGSGLTQLGSQRTNELIPLKNDDYPFDAHERDLLSRKTHRSGMLLSSRELATLVHPPGPSVRTPSLRTPARRTNAADNAHTTGEIVLGQNAHRGETVTVYQSPHIRLRHTYVIGATGTGKSTLLKSLLRQDIEAGRGVGILDPHGDLVDDILGTIPKERHKDVVLFDPADDTHPIGFNVLRAHSPREKDLLASDLAAIFRRFSTSWGDQMTAVLGNAILAILESPAGGTLVDLRRFLVDRRFRETFLRTVTDPQVTFFWREEFPQLAGRPQLPILTRLNAFLRPRLIRSMVVQNESKLDLRAVLDSGKIFLGKLAQGAIGEENAHLLGSLLIAKFHQMALSREQIPEAERRDFFLYLDEFHHFSSPSLTAMLSGSRKYHLGLVLAHQECRQLGDGELQSAALTNPATRICFRLGDDDARKLAGGFSHFQAEDLQSLGIGEALCRIGGAHQDFNLRVPLPEPIDEDEAHTRTAAIRELSRNAYGTPAPEVEELLRAAFETPPEDPQPDTKAPEAPEPPTPPAPQELQPTEPSGKATEETPEPPRKKATPEADTTTPSAPKETPLPGKGGQKHKYLQSLLKHYAEEEGFRATVEAALSEDRHVDLLLKRDDLTLGVEISITSTPTQELRNIEKCFENGIQRVSVVSPDRRRLGHIEKLARARLDERNKERVSFLTPEQFLSFLEELPKEVGVRETEKTVLGYRVKTRVSNAPDRSARLDAVTRTILGAMRKMRDS